MRPRHLLPILAMTALLAACQEDTPEAPEAVEPPGAGEDSAGVDADDPCGASGHQQLVGRHRDVLAAMTFPAPMRVIGPGDAVTMDFIPERLNVYYDEDGIIERVECG